MQESTGYEDLLELLHDGRFEELRGRINAAEQAAGPPEATRYHLARIRSLAEVSCGIYQNCSFGADSLELHPGSQDWVKNAILERKRYCVVPDPAGALSVGLLGPEPEKLTGIDESDCYRRVARMEPFPLAQVVDGFVFSREQTLHLPPPSRRTESPVKPVNKLPLWQVRPIKANPQARRKWFNGYADDQADVFWSTDSVDAVTREVLGKLLDQRAQMDPDLPLPMYQNIIDPNLVAVPNPHAAADNEVGAVQSWQPKKVAPLHTWCATEFNIRPIPSVDAEWGLRHGRHCQRLPAEVRLAIHRFLPPGVTFAEARARAPIHDIDPRSGPEAALLTTAAERVLTAALPMLTRLRRPALVLPGPLQAVVKAQRIYLQPGEEYEGVWHRDGKQEHVVAVVLYYYRVTNLAGGDIELVDKRPMVNTFWLGGDCTPTPLSERSASKNICKAIRRRVPIQTGTLVVFSNYQFVHRVLRMVHAGGEGLGYRDFVAFFIVDQRRPLPSTLGFVPRPLAERIELRKQRLKEQLLPSGGFGLVEGTVSSTGNGCAALLGYGDGLERRITEVLEEWGSSKREGAHIIELLNRAPPLNRGISWAAEQSPFYSPEQAQKLRR
eukprot:TRINITY_DN16448_c0_g1_i5.p1 TRINITY_DN16448_c0_g1~~TRINITY_DN16448_c0_g1_i5.p1  ORF type:complete len:617 (+),score=66.50 TRINITY_DN16448_c0_g1_i5:22-1851(+)